MYVSKLRLLLLKWLNYSLPYMYVCIESYHHLCMETSSTNHVIHTHMSIK